MKRYIRQPDFKNMRAVIAVVRDDGSIVRGVIRAVELVGGRFTYDTLHEQFECAGETIHVPVDGKLPGET